MTQGRTRRRRRWSDVGRGLCALVGAAVLVAGVPAALIAAVGSPLPAKVPTAKAVGRALGDGYIPDSFLVKALAVVCWLVWFELVTSLVVEAIAYARGRRAASVPLAGAVQRGAARLIAGIALLGAVTLTRSSPAPAPGVAPWASPSEPPSALVVDQRSLLPDASLPHAKTPPPTVATADGQPAPVYVVQHRDTLWDIAERHLGDPFRWREIFDINQGRPQADGTRLSDPDLIYAGWRLELPADAVGLAPASGGTATPAPSDSAPAPRTPTPGPGATGADDGTGGGFGDGGMVLIDEDALAGDVTLASGHGPGRDGMVLVPEGALDPPVSSAPPEVAGSDRHAPDDPDAAGSALAGFLRPSPPEHP